MGRSHGMNAEPMSFGTKFLSFYAELERRYKDLNDFIENHLKGWEMILELKINF